MTTNILLARAGAGKTEAAQRRLLELKRANPLAKAWVLLSTDRQIVDFRRRLAAAGANVLFNIEFFTFYPLYNRLLLLGGSPQRCLDDTARYGLLREIMRDLPLDIYRGIALKPGFLRIVAALIYELKQNLITPEAFALAAGNAKESELALIYAQYQTVLREHRLVDREGEGWLALDVLGNNRHLAADVQLLIVDGYDQFNYLQARLLSELGAQIRETVITLTTVEGREKTMGRRFTRALERLKVAHDDSRFVLLPVAAAAPGESDAFQHLADHLLRPAWQPYAAATDAIRLLEAPDPTAEAALVLRRIKRLLLDGVPPDHILIAARDWATYADAFATAARAYGVPIALNTGEALARNPAITALLNLLELPRGDFRRRDLFDALRSPYFRVPGMDDAAVSAVERVAFRERITGGREAWLSAVDALAQPTRDDEEDGEGQSAPEMDAERVAQVKAALTRFFDAITAPESGDLRVYVAWLEDLIGDDAPDPDDEQAPASPAYTLDMVSAIRALSTDQTLMERDLAALGEFNRRLRSLLSAASLLRALSFDSPAESFARDVRLLVEEATFQRGKARDGRVLITSVSDARGLPHDYVFIPGMAEGIFPAPTPEDPLLLDSERQRLATEYDIRLPTQAERADDEGLFYELIGLARKTLTLSRPCYKNGEPWAASHLYRAVAALFPQVTPERLGIGEVIPASDVGTISEAAITAVSASPELRAWFAGTEFWGRVELGLRVERGRLSRQPYDRYTGRLTDETLIRWAAEWLSPAHVWSASQLADFGMCAFRFFAGRLLNLEPLKLPEEGMDRRELGVIQHEILEKTYRQIAERGLTITPEHADTALEVLREVAAEVLPAAPAKLGFRPSALWADEQKVLLRRLVQVVKADFSGDSPISKKFPGERRPYQQEASFKDARLKLAGESVRARGVIDRIDRVGERYIIIDYKSGSSKIPKEHIEQGRNFQMLIYLTAARELVDDVAGGLFWHLSDRTTSGDLTPGDPVMAAGAAQIERMLAAGRAGRFDARANGMEQGKCARYCDFAQFCRVGMTNQAKADEP